ncbi:LD-carboxypeptidase [Thermodesulfobacteriota bacterium]
MSHIRHLNHGYNLIIPKPLKRGDLVAVVATSGPVEEANLNHGLEFLNGLGLSVVVGSNAIRNLGYLAGSDSERCMDLNAMLRNPDVRGIFFARGGYGVMRLLDSLDCGALQRDPKLLLGMSDITALQLSLFARLRLVTLSGPMIAGQLSRGLDALTEEWFVKSLMHPLAGRDLVPPVPNGLKVVRHGRGEGQLVGGCLSMVAALMGTPHAPDFTNTVLLLEDVHEPLYRLDRLMTQLKLSGVLDRLAGLLIGHIIGPKGRNLREEFEALVLDVTSGTGYPILSGVPHGHALTNLTLPHGVPVELKTDPPCVRTRATV